MNIITPCVCVCVCVCVCMGGGGGGGNYVEYSLLYKCCTLNYDLTCVVHLIMILHVHNHVQKLLKNRMLRRFSGYLTVPLTRLETIWASVLTAKWWRLNIKEEYMLQKSTGMWKYET